jgi:hypothetical protein
MQLMAARLITDHQQQLQQFVTSSTWDYVVVRRDVARDRSGVPTESMSIRSAASLLSNWRNRTGRSKHGAIAEADATG